MLAEGPRGERKGQSPRPLAGPRIPPQAQYFECRSLDQVTEELVSFLPLLSEPLIASAQAE